MSSGSRARALGDGRESTRGPVGRHEAWSLDRAEVELVPISSLQSADSPRIEGENVDHIRALAEVEGGTPPIIVHRATMQVVDGMHRLQAAIMRGRKAIEVRYIDGDDRDLFVLSVELNAEHGLPLSKSDRIAAAARVISSHPQWSDRGIADLTGLSSKTVAVIRRRSTEEIPQLNERIGRDGKVRPLTATQARRAAGRLMTERPDASLREVARAAGVSLGTAQDVRRRLRNGEDPVPAQRGSERSGRAAHPRSSDPPGVVPELSEQEAGMVMDSLRRLKGDPALRFSELGRAMLRLLAANSMPAEDWARLVESMPDHCVDAIATVARNCAHSWLRFSAQIEERRTSPG